MSVIHFQSQRSRKDVERKIRLWNTMWTVMWFASGTKERNQDVFKGRDRYIRHKVLCWYYDLIDFDFDEKKEIGVRR